MANLEKHFVDLLASVEIWEEKGFNDCLRIECRTFVTIGSEGVTKSSDYRICREAIALNLLQREGMKSADLDLQRQIALFTFDRYPHIFCVSQMAAWFLPMVLEEYTRHFGSEAKAYGYVFIRTAAAPGKIFDFRLAKKSWDGRKAEDDTPFSYPIKTDHGYTYLDIFNKKMRRRGVGLLCGTENGGEIWIPRTANFSEETVHRLRLVDSSYIKDFYQIYRTKGDCHAEEPYYKIAKPSPFITAKPEIPTI